MSGVLRAVWCVRRVMLCVWCVCRVGYRALFCLGLCGVLSECVVCFVLGFRICILTVHCLLFSAVRLVWCDVLMCCICRTVCCCVVLCVLY